MSDSKNALNHAYPKEHRHGWDCFKNSGGMTNACEESTPLYQRIEAIYKTAYRVGYRNGRKDQARGLDNEV